MNDMFTALENVPSQLKWSIINDSKYADDLFRIARDHKLTSKTLNKKGLDIYQPLLDFFISNGRTGEAILFLFDFIPDIPERSLKLKTLYDMSDSNNKKDEEA